MTINKCKMLRAYDCTEILESGCILSGIHAHKAHSIFPADSRILCRRNGPISPYPSDIMCRESKDLMSLRARVIIAVFSVNHASGARSPLTAGLRRTDEPAERQTGDTQTERQVRPASGDFVKHWWMGYYDDTTNYLKFWFQTNFVSINLFSESYHLIQLLLVRLRLHIWNSIHAAIHGLS